MDAYECLVTRRSVRKFSSKKIDKEVVKKILYAGQRAANARNDQNCFFYAVLNQERRNEIKKLCINNGPFIDTASLCVCIFSKDKYYLEDGSAASQNILNAAHSFGLGSVWVAGDKKDYADEIRKLLKVSDEYKLVSIIVIGYSDGETKLTPRKPLEEVIKIEE